MYVDELEYFFNCVKRKKTPMNSIIDGLEPQKIALAIKESSKCGKKIRIKQNQMSFCFNIISTILNSNSVSIIIPVSAGISIANPLGGY